VSGNQGVVFTDEIPTTRIESPPGVVENENREPTGKANTFYKGRACRD
jgi:hypothetical protein